MSERKQIGGAIRRIAWGYIFIHVHFNLITMDILADWFGYCMIFWSLSALAKREQSVTLLRPLGLILIFWNLFDWLMDIGGIGVNTYGLELVAAVLGLYFHFQLLTDLARIAEQYGHPAGRKLLHLRTARTVLAAVTHIFLYWLTEEMAVVWGIVIVQLILMVWLCSVLFKFGKTLLEEESDAMEEEIL